MNDSPSAGRQRTALSLLTLADRLRPKICQIVFGNGEIVGAGRSFGQHAHLVDEVGDELAPPDL
jgi:hypothetical protein